MKASILAIGGDSASLQELLQALSPLGHEVCCARDRREALRLFQDLLPRLVFVDATLEERSSARLCAELKRSEHGLVTPLVVIGEPSSQRRIDVMKAHGAVDFLVKPVAQAKLRTVAAWALAPPDRDASAGEDPVLARFTIAERTEGAVSLDSGSLPYLLSRSEEDRMTGTLLVQRKAVRKALLFQNGRITGARSNLAADRIGRVLLAMRLVTPGELARAESRLGGDIDLLHALTLLGHLPAGARQQVLRYRALCIGLSLCRWADGALQFLPGEMLECELLDEPIRPLRLAVLGLRTTPFLLDIARRRFVRDEVSFFKGRPGLLLSREGEDFLTLHERNLAALVDGVRSVPDLREMGRLAGWDADDALAVLAGSALVQKYAASGPRQPAEETPVLPPAEEHEALEPGSLADRPFVEVLGELIRKQSTGVLVVEDDCCRSFSLVAGEVVHAHSTSVEDALGQILVRERIVSATALQAALARQQAGAARPLGTLLIEMGELKLGSLYEALRRQILQILESTFAQDRGRFSFTPAPTVPEWSVRVGIGPRELLRRGAAAMKAEALSRRWCSLPRGARLVLRADALDGSVFSLFEHNLARAIRAGTPIAKLPGLEATQRPVLETVQYWAACGFAAIEIAEPEGAATGALAEERPGDASSAGTGSAEEAAAPADPSVLMAGVAGRGIAASLPESAAPSRDGGPDLAVPPAAPAVYTAREDGALVTLLREALFSERDERRLLEREVRAMSAEVARLQERLILKARPARPSPARPDRVERLDVRGDGKVPKAKRDPDRSAVEGSEPPVQVDDAKAIRRRRVSGAEPRRARSTGRKRDAVAEEPVPPRLDEELVGVGS